MVQIDPLTGLPKELLAMEEIVLEQQSIKVHIEKRRYGKLVTLVDGIGKSVDISDLAKQLKAEEQQPALTKQTSQLRSYQI